MLQTKCWPKKRQGSGARIGPLFLILVGPQFHFIIFVSLARLARTPGPHIGSFFWAHWSGDDDLTQEIGEQHTVKYGQPGTASKAMADVAPPLLRFCNTTSFHVLNLGTSHKSGHSSSLPYRSAFGSPERPSPITWFEIAQCSNTVWPRRRRRQRLRFWCKEKPKPAQAPGSARRPLGHGARILLYPSNKTYPQVPQLKPPCYKASIIYTFFCHIANCYIHLNSEVLRCLTDIRGLQSGFTWPRGVWSSNVSEGAYVVVVFLCLVC